MTMTRAGFPLYLQLKSWLLERIASNEWPEGTMIPTEQELMSAHGVSRTTVRQAVLDLVASGDLIRRQGRGTFVARPEHLLSSSPLYGFKEELDFLGHQVYLIDLKVDIIAADIAAATHLRIPVSTPVLRVTRTIGEHGEPIFTDESYLPQTMRQFLSEELLRHSPIYAVLEAEGVTIASGEQVIRAEAATPDIVHKLGCSLGSPIIQITRTTRDRSGHPIEFSVASYRGDAYEYRVRLTRKAIPDSLKGGSQADQLGSTP
ncbi:MAG: GntR family transcriptional regulator [Bacilli bacterium]